MQIYALISLNPRPQVRKLEFLMAEVRRGGHDSVLTIGGIQSNHCRRVLWVGGMGWRTAARQLGQAY